MADYGGGMYNFLWEFLNITNCAIEDNIAACDGGGMYNSFYSNPTLTNCTFSNNIADANGGAMFNEDSNPTVTNCILWGDTPNEIYNFGTAAPIVTHSNVQGGCPGTANIDADPSFADVTSGDLRLLPGSPCIDVGNSTPNLEATDLDGHPRIVDGDCDDTEVVDMGAYELNYAYMGDLDDDCSVDFGDFSIFAPAWRTEHGQPGYDPACNIGNPTDISIDWRDLAVIARNWLIVPL